MAKEIPVRTFFLGLVAAVAMLVSGEVAQAGFVSGSITFRATTQNPTSGTVLDTRSITNLLSNTDGSGDFALPNSGNVPADTLWQNFTLINPMPNRFTLSTAEFGTFDGLVKTNDLPIPGVVRVISYSGNFSGGTLFFSSGKQGLTDANLTVTLSQNGPSSFSTHIQLTTNGIAFVPEPASMAIFGIGAIGFAARRFRRK